MQRRRCLIFGAILAAAFAAGPTAGSWADTAPGPDCQGLLFSDASGDAVDDFFYVGDAGGQHLGELPGNPNEDLLGAWITSADGVATVHVQLDVMSKLVATSATSTDWYFGYSVNGADPVYVSLQTDGTNYVFGGGTVDKQASGGYLYSDDGKGRNGSAQEGDHGVVSIDLPEAGDGDEITGAWVSSDRGRGVFTPSPAPRIGVSSLDTIDAAPDGSGPGTNANSGDYTVGACSAAT